MNLRLKDFLGVCLFALVGYIVGYMSSGFFREIFSGSFLATAFISGEGGGMFGLFVGSCCGLAYFFHDIDFGNN